MLVSAPNYPLRYPKYVTETMRPLLEVIKPVTEAHLAFLWSYTPKKAQAEGDRPPKFLGLGVRPSLAKALLGYRHPLPAIALWSL